MNYYGAKELAESFRTVRKNTIQIAEDIPEGKYSFKAAPDVRSVEKLLTHIAMAPTFQHRIHAIEKRTTLEGFNFPALMQEVMAEEAKPRTKAQVLDLLRKEGEKWATFVDGLSDDFLGNVLTMPRGGTPPARSRFDMIASVKEHEMHHRGQLMLIERIIGIVPHLTRQMQERMAQAQQSQQQKS
jgi:uncharacterized damage-inducible protein DinB